MTMDVEGFQQVIRPQLLRSFSDHHETLLQICFGNIVPDELAVEPLNEACLDGSDLRRLAHMVRVEFLDAIEKEMKGSDETKVASNAEPNPYDVYLMETTMGGRRQNVAVCMPLRKSKENDRPDLMWYTGSGDLFRLEDLSSKWKVASLSGPARVLEALGAAPDTLMKAAMQREMLVSTSEVEMSDPLLAVNLNASQRQAVATVACPRFTEGFFAIHGPPGCGKTTTLVGMIQAALANMDPHDHILVTAPSNAGVANIALKLFSTERYSHHDLVVFGENCDPSVRFLNPRFRAEKYRQMCNKRQQLRENGAYDTAIDKVYREFISWLHLPDQDVSMDNLTSICPVSCGSESVYQEALGNARVVFCTLNSAGSIRLQRSLRASTVMLDEAGQTPEAEFFIATNFPGVKRMVVVGDPQQLPSTVINPTCASWLEKVQKVNPSALHLLKVQYRMDPAILAFPNRAFYQDRIESGENVRARDPPVDRPLLCIDTSGLGSEKRDNFSFHNVFEVAAIRSLLESDKDILRLLDSDPDARVIVITPYRSQAVLLEEGIRSLHLRNMQVATVDSFQGQEGEIVIVSTVRTMAAGFVDNEKRLNVALTRAKRVLRVVGDGAFFSTLRSSSTLKKLFDFAAQHGSNEASQARATASSPPPKSWSKHTLWAVAGNVRFYDCLKKMTPERINICWHTLHAVAQPDLQSLRARIPERDARPFWNISGLKRIPIQLYVVWIPKEGCARPIVEAHFAGTKEACRKFVQTNKVPVDACIAEASMSGLKNMPIDHPMAMIQTDKISFPNHPLASWPATNCIQKAVTARLTLPDGSVQLDPEQERLARSCPPLLCESRSGTGKTLVLLQHAAYFWESTDEVDLCFVTVSARLRNQLEEKHEEMEAIRTHPLPRIRFFTLEQLLLHLLSSLGIRDFDGHDPCRFPGFEAGRKSHEQLSVEAHLVENEIGGVILGSLEAAQQGRPLTREEYIANKRSNVEKESFCGIKTREAIFSIFLQYARWKRREVVENKGLEQWDEQPDANS